MIKIKSSTSLFGDTPLTNTEEEGLAEYRAEVLGKWNLVPAPRVIIPESTPDDPNKKQKISLEQPKEHTQILKGSTGNKIFSMLQNLKPSSSRLQKDTTPKTKSSDVDLPPKRKLAFG